MLPLHPIAALPAGWIDFLVRPRNASSPQTSSDCEFPSVIFLQLSTRNVGNPTATFPLAHRLHAKLRQQRSRGDTRSGAGAVYASARERFSAAICCVAGILVSRRAVDWRRQTGLGGVLRHSPGYRHGSLADQHRPQPELHLRHKRCRRRRRHHQHRGDRQQRVASRWHHHRPKRLGRRQHHQLRHD